MQRSSDYERGDGKRLGKIYFSETRKRDGGERRAEQERCAEEISKRTSRRPDGAFRIHINHAGNKHAADADDRCTERERQLQFFQRQQTRGKFLEQFAELRKFLRKKRQPREQSCSGGEWDELIEPDEFAAQPACSPAQECAPRLERLTQI